MTYEINGMGTTTFFPLDTPPSGGDTLYLSTTAAYNALSPIFREKLHSLSAIHSGVQQYNVTDGEKRHIRAPIETVHPVVRTHPVTKTKSLFVNRLYTKKIVGLKEEESFYLLNFLFDHIERGQDWHLRVHWTPGTVVVYDNRVTQHSALRDFKVEPARTRRHMVRITPQGERPVFVENPE
ncbi:Alpha-ketoglutarate-dependent sulfonate dioxygenase [Lachnellula arida]|uniref:Alpha-ketoglutarate-dependent sulfonate dioxygenase n=1 Tax=Lachnellula arida TaxID=1316785 RepID=A0A8T9B769_9HELO|nr:Alpha-ketoglutarate-dependent sulfonate dioxygenase [Lachnellula arida]